MLGTNEPVVTLEEVLNEVRDIVPPVWPLADYVAVNPFFGLSQQKFLKARQTLSHVRDCDLLMSREYFRSEWAQGRFTRDGIAAAHAECVREYPRWFAGFEPAEVFEWLEQGDNPRRTDEPRFRTVAEAVDQRLNSNWSSHIINDISRHCSAHFDQGQAPWPSPWKDLPLYSAWRMAAGIGRRMDMLGLNGFRSYVRRLPGSPQHAIQQALTELEIPRSHWRNFLLCELFSVAGWASFARYQDRRTGVTAPHDSDLVALLAIRLTYDVMLAKSVGIPWPLALWPADTDVVGGVAVSPVPATDVLARYTLQVAAEATYRQELLRQLAVQPSAAIPVNRKTLQIVFCIDVRSEVMRRRLEETSDSIETFGFAGFFGLPLEFVPLGASSGTAQCPVLLQPSFRVSETLSGVDENQLDQIRRRRQRIRHGRKLWKSFQGSAVSCFSFVETCGLKYIGKLLTDSLGWTRPAAPADRDGIPAAVNPDLAMDVFEVDVSGELLTKQCDLAENMLRNLGLIDGFARIVALCGHTSDVANNPYKAALDCGACGGHSGEPNARLAAKMLNRAAVREKLAQRGISIPADTWFVAAVHHTTTDEVRFCDVAEIPQSHAADFEAVLQWTEAAGRRAGQERCPRLNSARPTDLVRRSRDWAELRPEWGLAGNAAFVIAPRSRTRGLNLNGRVFLHSYDQRRDSEGKVLELILTAPMIVTNWINLQYYASTVDPVAFGSGNKAIHNVVGQFGVHQGNGGDLMTGLPWQCVHDGRKYQHEPLRLLVVVEAPREQVDRVLRKHSIIRELAANGWLTLMTLDDGRSYRWSSAGAWTADHSGAPVGASQG